MAYVSMLQHGSVKVQLRDGKGHLGRIHAPLGVFKKPYKTDVKNDDIPDQLSLNGAYRPSRLSVHVDRCCNQRCRCIWCLVQLSDHVSLLRTVTFLDAPDGEALELDVSRQIWEQMPKCL